MVRYRLFTVGIILTLFAGGITVASQMGITGKNNICEAYNRKNLIRLHVVANSDSREDQIMKLKVRDRILKESEKFLLRVEDPSGAERALRGKLKQLAEVARDELSLYHQTLPVKVELGQFNFPKKAYPFGILEAGRYKGVKVIIGEGKGHNWWCVLYPPLCLLTPDAPAYRKSVPSRISARYKLAFLEKMVKRKGLTMNQFWKKWGRTFERL